MTIHAATTLSDMQGLVIVKPPLGENPPAEPEIVIVKLLESRQALR